MFLILCLQAKRAALMASFIIHKTRERSNFTKAALKTLESIGTLEQFLIKRRKDYVDPHHRTTEEERDNIEHEVSNFVKACKEQIDFLQTNITNEELNSKGWLGIRGDNANADTVAPKHGVVVEATKNVELGNKESTQTIDQNSSSRSFRTFLLLLLTVLTFSVLFLD